MKIVVTGATSFVGIGAVKELLHRGHCVYAVLRENSAKEELLKIDGSFPPNLTILNEDLENLSRLPGRISEMCDVFLHMGWHGAGSSSRAELRIQQKSVENSLDAVRAAKELGCTRFLFTGSQAEYGIHQELMDETISCHPSSPYGEAKLTVRSEAEALCKSLGLDYGHACIFSTFGPGDHPWSLVSSCLDTFSRNGHIELSACTQNWNFLYIDDAGRAIADLAEYQGRLHSHGCVYNLAGPMNETGPLRGFVEKMYELCGSKGSFTYGTRPPNAEGVVSLNPDIRKMKRVVGWAPQVGFEQGILNILRKL